MAKSKPKFRQGQVVFDKINQAYVRIWRASRVIGRNGYFVVNAAPEHRFRRLTAHERGSHAK